MTPKKDKIVVVGASRQEDDTGFKIFKDLINFGFSVDGVNPENGEIAGKKFSVILKNLIIFRI